MRRNAHAYKVMFAAVMTIVLVAPMLVFAQEGSGTSSSSGSTGSSATAVESVPVAQPAPTPVEAPAPSPTPESAQVPPPAPQLVPPPTLYEGGNSGEGEGGNSQPPVSAQEVRDFKRQFQENIKEAKQLLRQMGTNAGAAEWKNSLNEVITQANDCIAKFSQAAADEQREIMSECWNLRLWENINDVRDQFVPPSEIRNVMQEIKNQTRDLARLKKQAAKVPSAGEVGALVDNLHAQIDVFKNNITNAAGRDQREAMRDYWDAQLWEEINKVRARVELPRELQQITKEFKRAQKQIATRSAKTAFAFFAVDENSLQSALLAKQAVIEQIGSLASQGNGEDAYQLMNEEIHQAWHPGDLSHLIGMLQEMSGNLKRIKDADIKEQIKVVMGPIIEAMNEGDYREAKEAMMQFSEQMRRYERVFRPYYGGERDIDDRTMQALDKLEQIIQQKLQKDQPTTPAAPAL